MPEYGLAGFMTPEAARQSAVEHGYPDAVVIARRDYWYWFCTVQED